MISREANDVQQVVRGRVHADQLVSGLPWLRELYRAVFRELGEQATGHQVYAAADERYGTVLNVQRGSGMRFECHVDSNPLTGLLFCTDHGPGAGGELVFGHDKRPAAWLPSSNRARSCDHRPAISSFSTAANIRIMCAPWKAEGRCTGCSGDELLHR